MKEGKKERKKERKRESKKIKRERVERVVHVAQINLLTAPRDPLKLKKTSGCLFMAMFIIVLMSVDEWDDYKWEEKMKEGEIFLKLKLQGAYPCHWLLRSVEVSHNRLQFFHRHRVAD